MHRINIGWGANDNQMLTSDLKATSSDLRSSLEEDFGAIGFTLKALCVRASLSWHLSASWVENKEEDWSC